MILQCMEDTLTKRVWQQFGSNNYLMGTATAQQPAEPRANSENRSLLIALALITGSLVVEIGSAFLSGSLALLADAADMVTNFTAISLALLSLWLARRPATVIRTFGLLRTEVLVAMVNALVLWVIATWIFIEAYQAAEKCVRFCVGGGNPCPRCICRIELKQLHIHSTAHDPHT